MGLNTIKTVLIHLFTLVIILACGGCATGMIESSIKNSGAGYAEGEVPSRQPKDLLLPVVCFTVSLDSSDCPVAKPGLVWLLDVTNVATGKFTSIQIKPDGPVKYRIAGDHLFSGGATDPIHLIVLRLPPGEYALGRILFENDVNCKGNDLFKSKYIGLDKKDEFIFTVKESQVTYAGRVTMKITGKRGSMGWILASSIDYGVEWSNTVEEDKKWAQDTFPCLKNKPSETLPMRSKPTSTKG